MNNCDVLDLIKKLDIEKQRDFTVEDILEIKKCDVTKLEHGLKTYEKLGILKINEKGNYMIKNMCMLSQF